MALLRDYASRHSEQAFATLVSRHIDLVYSVACRHVGNHHQAEEITQAVFVILARKARSLAPGTILPGWLFRTARLTAANYLRGEIRRARREQEAYMQSTLSENAGDSWQEIAPLLNDAIDGLREQDRNAIVLRFFKGKGYKEVAAALGGTEEAAQMRVSRALEKLRQAFANRGVVLSGTALGGLMTAHGTQAAPLGLAASVTAAAVHGTALTASALTLVKGTMKIMAWTKLKLAVGAGVAVLLACQYSQNVLQARQIAAAREDLRVRSEASGAQEQQIAELEQQTTAIVETQRNQEQELTQLRARRKAGAAGAQAKPGVAVPTTLLSAALEDPIARDALRQQLVNGLRSRWDPLVKELKLNSDDAEKLFQFTGDQYMKNIEAVAAFTEGKLSAEEAVQAGDQAAWNATNQVRQMLGEEGFARLEQYNQAYPARALVEQFQKQLGFFGLNAAQQERLSGLIAAEPFDVTSGLAGDMGVRDLVLPDALDRRFEQQVQANQEILQGASEFLDPNQVNALELMQAYNLNAQKRNVLRALRKL